MDTTPRRQRLADLLDGELDALLVTKLVNVRYLTGFTGSNGAAIVKPDGSCALATDGRYTAQAAAQAPGVDVVEARAVGPDLLTAAVGAGARRIGIERHHVTLAAHDALVEAAGGAELVDGGQRVETLRVQKDDAELEAIRAACAITADVFDELVETLAPGRTELDLAWDIRAALRARGAELAFDSIVAFGPSSAEPHHEPTGRVLVAGDLVKLDFGGKVDGYHADMTRTVVVGPAADWQRELHALVADVQAELRAATVPGAVPVELDTLAADRIRAAGHEPVHGLGHGVGLEIHESPFLVPGSGAARLADRVPVTVEPGVYLPGRGGVRIEDTVVVRAGGAESLTTAPRELIEI